LIAFVNSRAPSAHFHFQTQRRSGFQLLPQSSHFLLPSSVVRLLLLADPLRRNLGVCWGRFSHSEGALLYCTWSPIRPHRQLQLPTTTSSLTAYDICHVIRHGDNTYRYSSCHELLVHAANPAWAPHRLALPASPDINSLEWLLSVLRRLEPKPTKPIEYAVQHSIQRL
jgi:hypothetical protein